MRLMANSQSIFLASFARLLFCAIAFSLGIIASMHCSAQENVGKVDSAKALPGAGNEFNRQILGKLVEKLSSSQFSVREEATEELIQIADDSMLPELQLTAQSLEDLEAKLRLRAIIAKIKSERQQTQIRSFLRSGNPSDTFGFDGWKSFSQHAGTSRSAKQLFLKLLDRYPELVEHEIESPEEALKKTEFIASVIGEAQAHNLSYQLADGIALLYCVSACRDLFDHRMERICLHTFRISPFGPFLSEVRFRKALEPMLSAWASKVKDYKLECLLFFLEKDIPYIRELAIELLESRIALDDEDTFVIAMQAMYRFGLQSDLPLIEKWLDNSTVCNSEEVMRLPDSPAGKVGFVTQTVERRDAALAVAMRITGDNPTLAFPLFATHPIRGFVHRSIALPKDDVELRTKRIEEWRRRSRTK
jgi:hypothetical protein